MTRPSGLAVAPASTDNPWHALWALLVGFFMILVDATIVAVANPSIMDHLGADYDAVIWVTSAYLLAYAVPLLLAGRLGDRFGPKNLYLVGLAVFTAASLWCGLSGSIETLIAARVVQGLGAALLTPQTLSTITRIFPPERRGVALSVWGATAGVATLLGPLAGGVLVDGLGWQWIFIVNVPIGVIGLGLAYYLVPSLPTKMHDFDVLGVVLSGTGMFLVVFALQEGQSHHWALWIWGMIAAGVVFVAGFVYWQAVNPGEPLIPLKIFRDNDFSLANVGIAVIGFSVTAMVVPVFFYAQAVCGLSPTRAALLTAPMPIATGVLARFVGQLVDRAHPRPIVGFGFSALSIALTWLSVEMTPTTPIWRLVLPFILIGVGMAFIWSPLAATATRNLPGPLAGAGSGVYNTTRQVGSVLGSASIAAFMTSRISAEMPGGGAAPAAAEGSVTKLPAFLHEPFSAALSQSLLLPAFVALFGVVAALFLRGFGDVPAQPAADEPDHLPDEHDYFPDDDEYVEYTIDWDEPHPPRRAAPSPVVAVPPPADMLDVDLLDEGETEPLPTHVEPPLPAPADSWHAGPVESWHSLLDDEPLDEPEPTPYPEPIGFAHNGFHVEHEERFQPLPPERSGRHSRSGDDDGGTYGRHSTRFRDE
ncbi:MFS transporter [Mycobacterium sp. URHB0044]|uniref:MFS transporter n=1 Tax=Mycobacterium sp. URHB0044 TaxID=1380386 RepID=UPI00048F5867|nr:MFS transporter [Mycobacterium sp. URHB0044]